MKLTLYIKDNVYKTLSENLPKGYSSFKDLIQEAFDDERFLNVFLGMTNPGLSEIAEEIQHSTAKISIAVESLKPSDSPFNNFGLRHSIQYLNSIQNEIPFWEIDKQSEFADEICRQHFNNPTFKKNIMNADNPDFKSWNTTSVGNLAFVALATDDLELSRYCTNLLNDYKEYMQKKLKGAT